MLHLLIGVECGFQVPHDELTANAIGRHDELPQKLNGQSLWLCLRVFHDDLGKRQAGEILAGFGVDNFYVSSISDQSSDVFQVDISAAGSVIQSTVSVFLDDSRSGLHGKRSLLQCTIVSQIVDKCTDKSYL